MLVFQKKTKRSTLTFFDLFLLYIYTNNCFTYLSVHTWGNWSMNKKAKKPWGKSQTWKPSSYRRKRALKTSNVTSEPCYSWLLDICGLISMVENLKLNVVISRHSGIEFPNCIMSEKRVSLRLFYNMSFTRGVLLFLYYECSTEEITQNYNLILRGKKIWKIYEINK